MSKKARYILIAVILVFAIGIGALFLTSGYMQKQDWISKPVQTQLMSQMRSSTSLGTFAAKSLISKEIKAGNATLYNALSYPEVLTVICTVTAPEEFHAVAAYLVDDKGRAYSGWYEPALVQYGIMKVAFEQVTADQFVSLDLVDQSAVGPEGYSPDDKMDARIRFILE